MNMPPMPFKVGTDGIVQPWSKLIASIFLGKRQMQWTLIDSKVVWHKVNEHVMGDSRCLASSDVQ